MSERSNKRSDLSQLKDLVKEKTKRFKQRKTDQNTEEKSSVQQKAVKDKPLTNHKKTRPNAGKNDQKEKVKSFKNDKSTGGKRQKQSAKANERNVLRMPQYGQNIKHGETLGPLHQSDETVVVTINMNKPAQFDEKQLFQWLCETFPKCFNAYGKKPLKIGISEDIEQAYQNEFQIPVDPVLLKRVLRRYVSDQHYQKAILNHTKRYNLEGKPLEPISPEHQAHARDRLAFLEEKEAFIKQGGSVEQFYQMKRAQNAETLHDGDSKAPAETYHQKSDTEGTMADAFSQQDGHDNGVTSNKNADSDD
jgi:sRNA-binding protein